MSRKKSITVLLSLTACFTASLLAVEPKLTDEKYLEGAAWNVGSQSIQSMSKQFGLSDKERQAVINGLVNGAQGKAAPFDLEKQNDNMISVLQARASKQMDVLEKEVEREASSNKMKSAAYFKSLDDKKIAKTASGLYYQILKAGDKELPKETSTVKVDYVGTLIDGKEFDSSIKRGQPATFNLQGVIPGFKEGLQLIGKGGKIRLFIPAELGYGNSQLPGIPAGSVLIFDVDMIDVINEAKKS